MAWPGHRHDKLAVIFRGAAVLRSIIMLLRSPLGDTPLGEVQTTVTAGNSTLTYDPTSDRYQYMWKTNSAWAGTCQQLMLTLDDGSSHSALFRFRR